MSHEQTPKVSIRAQFFRFATVGIVANLTLYSLYLMVTWLGVEHKVAMTVLYLTAVTVTFTVNRQWSFRHGGVIHSAFLRYVIAYLAGYLLNLTILWLAVDHLELPHQAVQLFAISLVAVFLFIVHRTWVFEAVGEKEVT